MKIRFGFTLVELLIVIAIITMLAGIITVGGKRAREMAYTNKVKADIAALEVALGRFHADTGDFPEMGDSWPCNIFQRQLEEGFDKDGNPIDGWKGPYMYFDEEDLVGGDPQSFVDPWREHYLYGKPGEEDRNGDQYFDLWSGGPDKRSEAENPETCEDDITNW